MTGLLLIAVVAGWLFVAWWIAKKATAKITASGKKTALRVGITALLMALPLTDEIVGGFQFRALCSENAELKIVPDYVKGRVTRLTIDPANEYLKGTAIPIRFSEKVYTDIHTNEEIARFKSFVAKGGKFIHLLGISQTNAPLTIGRASCSPEDKFGRALPSQYKFTVIN
jgi:hypothetical protein